MDKLKLEGFLPYRLNRISMLVSQEFRKVYGPNHDLTIPEWRVLATLGQFEEMGAKDIGSHSSMHKTKVSRAVRSLEERRWLKRETRPNDRREEILSLTALGRRTYADIVPRALEFERRITKLLGRNSGAFLKAIETLEQDLIGSSHSAKI
jgi:DNA-binding MarR family transcriptional regulator